MNLSSYLQMPPAPLVPTSTSITAPQGARAGAGPSTGANLGFDFAEVMARQMQRLVPLERQTIAADTQQNQEQQPESQARPQESSQQLGNQRSNEPSNQKTRDAHTSSDATDEDANNSSTSHTHHRARVATPKTATADASLLEGLAQAAPLAPTPPVQAAVVATTANAATATLPTTPESSQAAGVNTPTPLQTIELSPQVRIITDPKKAPSPESLAAFAKSMGLDESAIQNLLGQAPATAPTAITSAAGLTPGIPTGLPAAVGTALNGMQAPTMPAADSTVATQLAAMSANAAQTAATASGAGVGAVANAATVAATSVLPGLTPTDMAAIQQLQITVLPPVVLPVNTAMTSANTPAPSTIDMLSLLGTGVDDKDVSALLSRFSEDAGSEGNPEQQQSQGDGNNFSNFAQALTRNSNAANAAPANAAQAAAPNMSEVYDQLSDKMATELAARMHKQLSDGEWKMKFALRPSNLGGVEIQLEMKDGKLDAVFRADNPLTRDLLQNSSQRLREALGNLGINAGQVNIGQGGGNAQQNNSGNAGKQSQVRDNSSSQVNGSDSASSVTSARSKANASLLDLYA